MYSSSMRCPSAPEHWSVFCFALTSCAATSSGAAAQPSRTPGRNVFDVVPACATVSGARLQRLGGPPAPEENLRGGAALDDKEAVPPCRLAEPLPALDGQADAGRVLVVR